MSGSHALGKIKIPYYRVPKGKHSGYWLPSKKMKALGFAVVRCGKDGPAAWATAEEWNKRWQAVRKGKIPAPAASDARDRETAELARVYPPGSVGYAFHRYLQTDEWKTKPLSTRQKVLWPAWFRIREMWGDVSPNTITFEMISAWRKALADRNGLNVSHKALKFWRALWRVMLAMRIAKGEDPSLSVVNVAPGERWQTWSEGETVILVKHAIRTGQGDLAAIIATVWDTQFQPGDARTLRAKHMAWIDAKPAPRLVFDRRVDGRQKTGKAAIGTLSRRSERLVVALLRARGTEMTDEAFLFRTRTGLPWRDDALADDFAALREQVFPGDKRQLRDMRRAGAVETLAGGGRDEDLAAKMANSIQRSNKLRKTYVPLEIEPVLIADDYRLVGRVRMRGRNEPGKKVETLQPVELKPLTKDRAK